MASRHSFLRSLSFAWDGLVEGAVRDRNLRIHLALGVLAGAFAARAPLSPAARALLLLCIALVVAAEAANSALESVVDLVSPGPDERARIAKDAAAAAVLVLAAGSVLVFLAVAGPIARALVASATALELPAAGTLAAATATAFLPAPTPRPRVVELLVGAGGVAGLGALAAGAESQAGTLAAALCLAVAAGGAARRRRPSG